jgi:pimeloyl-ACP methyl ester carboxylesterase
VRGDADLAGEGAPRCLDRSHSGSAGDDLDGCVDALEQGAGGFEADLFDVSGRCHLEFADEQPGQMSLNPARSLSAARLWSAAGFSATLRNILGLSQRLIAAGSFVEASGPPAWRKLPAWAAVGMADTAAGADIVLSMAKRANADITEIDASHVVMISQPAAVTDVILKALKAVS